MLLWVFLCSYWLQILCDGQLPLIGFVDKVERELVWKVFDDFAMTWSLLFFKFFLGRLISFEIFLLQAERSDSSAKPNPFKLLYAFEMHRNNWRKAASYMYLYSVQMRAVAALKDHQPRSLALQERLNGLSTAINALHLVHPAYAWIEAPVDETFLYKENYPSKKARTIMEGKGILSSAVNLCLGNCQCCHVRWLYSAIHPSVPPL